MSVTISVFNANTEMVNININNGSGFSINGTTSAVSYYPLMPTPADTPAFGSHPGPNVLAPGSNALVIAPTGTNQPSLFQVAIPTDQQITSLQLYVFWGSETTVGYALLNAGRIIAMEKQPIGSPS